MTVMVDQWKKNDNSDEFCAAFSTEFGTRIT